MNILYLLKITNMLKFHYLLILIYERNNLIRFMELTLTDSKKSNVNFIIAFQFIYLNVFNFLLFSIIKIWKILKKKTKKLLT